MKQTKKREKLKWSFQEVQFLSFCFPASRRNAWVNRGRVLEIDNYPIRAPTDEFH